MLKRLLFLGLLCAGFALLTGLMVQNVAHGGTPPRFGGYETPYFAPAPAQADARAAQALPAKQDACVTQHLRPCVQGPLADPALDKPFEESRYHAFHLSDKAG